MHSSSIFPKKDGKIQFHQMGQAQFFRSLRQNGIIMTLMEGYKESKQNKISLQCQYLLLKMYFILALVLIYWVGISVLAVKINLNTFRKYSKYGRLEGQKEEWEGIMRKDYHKWNKKSIIIGSFTILPYRFFALANFLGGALMFAIVIGWLNEGQLKVKAIEACIWYFNNYGKLMNNIAIKIEDNCPNPSDSKIKTPIIISNHSCWFDTFYITLKFSPVSYVAKYEIQFWPVIGPLSKSLNCIFVKRQKGDNSNNTKELIKQRIDDFYNNKPNASPLVIYPEGTTSNNRVILNFKSGAFQNLTPLTMLCLRYQCEDFLMGEDELQQSQHIFLMLSQWNKLSVKKIQISPSPQQTIQQYMQRCKDTMANTLNFRKVNAGYRDRLEIQKLRKQDKKQD